MLKIVTVPHPALTKKTRPVAKIDKKIIRLVRDMEQTLDAQVDPEGVGLSAPQVNVGLSVFIIKHPAEKNRRMTFINPEIIQSEYLPKEKKDEEHEDSNLEGCLSIPGIWAPVDRYDRVLVKFQELDGTVKEEWFTGFTAVVVQHEYDHLEGILFTTRALEQGHPIYKEKNGKLHEIDWA